MFDFSNNNFHFVNENCYFCALNSRKTAVSRTINKCFCSSKQIASYNVSLIIVAPNRKICIILNVKHGAFLE